MTANDVYGVLLSFQRLTFACVTMERIRVTKPCVGNCGADGSGLVDIDVACVQRNEEKLSGMYV